MVTVVIPNMNIGEKMIDVIGNPLTGDNSGFHDGQRNALIIHLPFAAEFRGGGGMCEVIFYSGCGRHNGMKG